MGWTRNGAMARIYVQFLLENDDLPQGFGICSDKIRQTQNLDVLYLAGAVQGVCRSQEAIIVSVSISMSFSVTNMGKSSN